MSKRHKPDPKQLFHNLAKDFHELVSNKQLLRKSIDTFLENLVDEVTLGIIFDTHRKFKTNAYDLDVDFDDSDDESPEDIISQHNMKKTTDCVCPICRRSVGAAMFAPHLEKCMGMGRISRSRNATRRVVKDSKEPNKDANPSYSGSAASDDDDDDDDDWNIRNKKKKKKKHKNGTKKIKGGTPKKAESMEIGTIDVEGDEDDLTILRHVLHLQDEPSSSSYSMESSSSSPSGSSKKNHKSKMKKSGKRDRSTPSLRFTD